MNDSLFDIDELAALENASFFRVKARIDDKIKELFNELKQGIEDSPPAPNRQVPDVLWATPGRMFRGENHHGFPWRAVDVPRYGQQGNLFIFRALVLWGHHCSLHLILDGTWLTALREPILAHQAALADAQWQLDLRDSAWEWFQDESLIDIGDFSETALQAHLQRPLPFKMSRFYPISELAQLPALAQESWQTLAPLLFPA